MSAAESARSLQARLLDVVERGTATALADEDFDALARAVFPHQFHGNAVYRRYCEQRGATPDTIATWTEIPFVPTDAFKAAPLVVGEAAVARAVFRTSGTTRGAERRGTHYLPDLSLYNATLRAGFAAHLLPDGARPRIVSLVPAPADAPDSSLSHMVGEVMRAFGAEDSAYFVDPHGGIDRAGLARALRAAEADGAPVCIVGTAFAFVHWLDALRADAVSFRLPPTSRVMDTGGFKGRSREVARAELYGEITARTGIEPAWLVNEYGMTEMSSQFYDGTAGTAAPEPDARWYAGPPWVRTQAADPETLRSLPHGEVGVLRHLDLANLGSVAAIQTADLGITGPTGFRLLGRARGAEARGCSLAMDDLLSALRGG